MWSLSMGEEGLQEMDSGSEARAWTMSMGAYATYPSVHAAFSSRCILFRASAATITLQCSRIYYVFDSIQSYLEEQCNAAFATLANCPNASYAWRSYSCPYRIHYPNLNPLAQFWSSTRLLDALRSSETISWTSASNATLRFQPSSFSAFAGSPRSRLKAHYVSGACRGCADVTYSTSAGRKYCGSTLTNTLPDFSS